MICETLKIKEIIRNNVFLDLSGNTKEEIIKEILDRLEQKGQISNKNQIFEEIMRREAISSTGVGEGIALPHIRSRYVSQPLLAAGISKKGVDFNASDAQPVKIIFLLITPADDCDFTIRLLSALSCILQQPSKREKFMRATEPSEFIRAINEKEG